MQELYEQLNTINKILWCLYVPALYVFYHLSKKGASEKSNLITVIILFGANSLMLGYQAVLDWYMAVHPGVNPVVNFFWFMGFASFYWIGMKVLYRIHKNENVRIEKLGQYISLAFFAAGSLQLLQYAEIVLFKTNQHIFTLYTFGIPAINIATLVTCMGYALVALYHFHFGKKKLAGNK